ncbi:MAG: four helix bundle protein [Prevotella sp.]|nr:four helix bundle protein [Prevotella sp.]
MKRRPNILLDKADAFSTRIIKMQQYLCSEKKEFILSKQVLRSGTSICANLTESKNAQSSLDYLSKHNIALKEADETAYWLKKLHEGGYINEIEYNSMNGDCEELIKMLVSSVKTLKLKNGRPVGVL